MDVMDELVIREYFNLGKTIQGLQDRLNHSRWLFYQQTMTSHIEYTALGVVSVGFRPDKEISKLYERMEKIERRIARNTFRRRHFEDYLAHLTVEDLERLESKYIDGEEVSISDKLLSDLYAEIDEIETAICFREGLEPDPEKIVIDLNEGVEGNLERLCEFFAL